jgi:hypothetical protein
MANVYATKSGNWSDTTVWNTLALPTSVDDVFANNFIVTVDINTRVLSIRTTAASPAVAGGNFRINHGVSLSANVLAGASTCLSFLSAAPNFCTLFGDVTGSGTTANVFGLTNNSSGTFNIIGNVVTANIISQAGATGAVNSSTGNMLVRANIFGGGAGGINNPSTGFLSVTGNVFGSQTTVNVVGISNNGTCEVYGNVRGGPQVAGGAGGNSHGISNNAVTSRLTVYGNLSGAAAVTATGYGVINSSSGVVNIIGNVQGLVANGLFNSSSGTVSITGNVVGGPGSSAHGIQNGSSSTGTIVINGNAIGGTGSGSVGIVNVNLGSVIVDGNVIGNTGSLSYGAFNSSTGLLYVRGTAIGNGWGLGSSGIGGAAPGIFGSQTGTTIVQSLCCGPRGQWPTAGNVFILPQQNSTITFETSAFLDVTLFTSLSTNITPPVSSVRLGTKYNLNDYTGTCAIPSVSSVLQGTAIDNSIGIAALQPQTVWSVSTSAIDINSLGGRLKESATVQSFGQLLTAFNI